MRVTNRRVMCAAILTFAAAFGIPRIGHAQARTDAGADTVVSFIVGSRSGIGREPIYFPANVLDLPDTAADAWAPSVDPARILSLGMGGEITLRFDRNLIIDGPGPDFSIFENAFYYTAGGRTRTFAEPGEVSVSRDGETFIVFPFDSLSLQGCAGVTPVGDPRRPLDPMVSGGDAFDLAAIGVDSVRYVRIRDVTAIVLNNPDHPFWDPTLSGFDLDAVVALNVAKKPIDSGVPPSSPLLFLVGTSRDAVRVHYRVGRSARIRLHLYTTLGRQAIPTVDVDEADPTGVALLDMSGVAAGFYLAALESDGEIVATTGLLLAR